MKERKHEQDEQILKIEKNKKPRIKPIAIGSGKVF
jgi:hypothetical protein